MADDSQEPNRSRDNLSPREIPNFPSSGGTLKIQKDKLSARQKRIEAQKGVNPHQKNTARVTP